MSRNPPFLLAVAGGSASGKKAVCNIIVERLAKKHRRLSRKVAIVSLTDFYRQLTPEEMQLAQDGEFNFDHPDAFDWALLESFLDDIMHGRATAKPIFDYQHKKRLNMEPFPQADIVLLEGILVLYQKSIYERMSMKVFVDLDSDVRLSRTVTRDTLGTNNRQVKHIDTVLNQWIKWVKPAFEDFILPCKKVADIIIPRGPENIAAIQLLTQHIDDLISAGGSSDAQSPIVSIQKSPALSATGQAMQALNLDEKPASSPRLAPSSVAIDVHREHGRVYNSTPN
ncbi:hypothetical protein RI367_005941 [Sorochytrium milnesiophthora]